MPETFDASEVRLHINDFIEELGELTQDQDTLIKYRGFVLSVYRLDGITQKYYTPDAAGRFPVLDRQARKEILTAYEDAMRNAETVSGKEETDSAGKRMKGIADGLLPLMTADYAALELIDVSKQKLSLPELIAKGRSEAVDMGSQRPVISKGSFSERQHIIVQNGGKSEEGFFTAKTDLNFAKDFKQMWDRLEEKYGELGYSDLIGHLRTRDMDSLLMKNWMIYSKVSTKMSTREMKEAIKEKVHKDYFENSGVRRSSYESLKDRDDYCEFLDDLYKEIKPLAGMYRSYSSEIGLKMHDGQNVDKRNIGMTRVAELLGMDGLVCEARPMVLMQGGKPVIGTFMKKAQGVDIRAQSSDSPLTLFTEKNMDTPEGVKAVSKMQVLDFICGNIDRHLGNFFLRFDPPDGPDARLINTPLIDNDMSFGMADAGSVRVGKVFVLPRSMGVIGESTYNALKALSKEELSLALSDCGLSKQQIDQAWTRSQSLIRKIEADREYFKDKEKGEIANGRIRAVPETDWELYRMTDLAEKCPASQFHIVLNVPKIVKSNDRIHEKEKAVEDAINEVRKKVIGPRAVVKSKSEQKKDIPVGVVIGTGIAQEKDPLNSGRENTLHLAAHELLKTEPVGQPGSRRYPLAYFNADRREVKGYFTPAEEQSAEACTAAVWRRAMDSAPRFIDELRRLKAYYSFGDPSKADDAGAEKTIPLTAEKLAEGSTYREIGFSKKKMEQLKNDPAFAQLWQKLAASLRRSISSRDTFERFGIGAGKRIELRNVAVSEAGDVLGVPGLLARSRTAQVMSSGRIADGVFTEQAVGFDISSVKDGSFMARIDAEQAKTVYNDPEGLKSLADLQVLDLICMNGTRSETDMFFRFEGIGTDKVRFAGVQGTGSSLSFGTNAPAEIPEITVISGSMADKLMREDTAAKLAEKMRDNGLGDAEIQAMERRIAVLRVAIENKTVRVVADGEWSRGENTLESLSKTKGSVFDKVQNRVVAVMAGRAAAWESRPEQEMIPDAPEETKFGRVIEVGRFGANAEQQKRLDELQRQAEKENFINAEKQLREAAPNDSLSPKELIRLIKQQAVRLETALDKADPFYKRSSGEYKDVKKACAKLKKTASNALKRMNDDSLLGVLDNNDLFDELNKLLDVSGKYISKKNAESSQGQEPSYWGGERIKASRTAAADARKLKHQLKKTLDKQLIMQDPMPRLQRIIKDTQRDALKESGDKLREIIAEEIYYKSIAGSDLTVKKNAAKLASVTDPDTARREIGKIRSSRSFRALVKRSDSELRALAANSGRLMETYFKEIAKIKLAEEIKAKNKPAPRNKEKDPNVKK